MYCCSRLDCLRSALLKSSDLCSLLSTCGFHGFSMRAEKSYLSYLYHSALMSRNDRDYCEMHTNDHESVSRNDGLKGPSCRPRVGDSTIIYIHPLMTDNSCAST